jgi:hypothetical protein
VSQSRADRRRHPRAKGVAGLTVGAGSEVIGVQVKDISLNGLSFSINRPVEFMTRLEMTLAVPHLSDRDGRSRVPSKIQCEGAVVRCDPIGGRGNRYEVAVFFTNMDDEAREAIGEYVRTQLETHAKYS